MGKKGFLPISANFLLDKWVKTRWTNYVRGCEQGRREANTADWRVARSIFVHDDTRRPSTTERQTNGPYRFYYRNFYQTKEGNRHEVFNGARLRRM